jgi:predicted MPP superfamily phosphohydrolase
VSPEARLKELRERILLARGSATLLLAVAEGPLDESRRLLCELLRAAPMVVVDLGGQGHDAGPALWAGLTQAERGDAYVLSARLQGALSESAFVRLLNAERELLRSLAGPTLLVVSAQTEQALRRHAPDFYTWLAQSYVLPELGALSEAAGRLGAKPSDVVATPAEEPVRFLHLSDVHLQTKRVKSYDQDRVLRGLVEFLGRDRATFPLDLLFVTGDLAQSGKADEYELVADLVRELLRVTSVPPERVFVVPGNHDVDRGVGRWLLRTLKADDESTEFFEEESSRVFHAQKFEAYGKALRGLLGAARPLGLEVGEKAVEMVEVRGTKVAVASFNSAWFCQGDDDQGKLWLGEANVDRAAQRVREEDADFAVALLHHPFDYLHEHERESVERYLERAFDLVLRGHLHQNKARTSLSARGGFVEVAAPAANQGSQWPNGCFLGEIRPRGRTVRLRPYAYASGADPWVLDPKMFPDDEADGHCHTFPVAEKQRGRKGTLSKHLEQAAEEALRSASMEERLGISERLEITVEKNEPHSGRGQKVARALRTQASDPAFWSSLSGKASKLAFVRAIHSWAEGRFPEVRISSNDPEFLEKALARMARVLDDLREELTFQDFPETELILVVRAILEHALEGQVREDVRVSNNQQVDILFGDDREPAERRAVIEVKKSKGRRNSAMVQRALSHLDQYLESSDAKHGALIIFGVPPQQERAPTTVEQVETPAGRDVLLLHF